MMVNVDLFSVVITKVSNVLNTLVSGEKPGFQALSKGLMVRLCAEVLWQGVPVDSRCRGITISCCVADLRCRVLVTDFVAPANTAYMCVCLYVCVLRLSW